MKKKNLIEQDAEVKGMTLKEYVDVALSDTEAVDNWFGFMYGKPSSNTEQLTNR